MGEIGDIFEAYDEMVLGVQDGAIVFANGAARDFFQMPLVGQKLAEVLPDFPSELKASKIACLVQEVPVTVTVSALGELFILSCQRPAVDQWDVQGRFFADLGQKINEDVSLLLMVGGLLQSQAAAGDARSQQYVEILNRSSFQLGRLARNLEAFSSLPGGDGKGIQLENVDVPVFLSNIASTADHVLAGIGVQVRFSTPYGSKVAALDPLRAEWLLLSLIANSVQSMPDGGVVELKLQEQGDNLVIAVKDNGRGMTAEELRYAFQAYQRPREMDVPRGLGLGLSVAANLARKHGGLLMLESREGIGTTVEFSFPNRQVDKAVLKDVSKAYGQFGMRNVLMEFSEILGRSYYGGAYLD